MTGFRFWSRAALLASSALLVAPAVAQNNAGADGDADERVATSGAALVLHKIVVGAGHEKIAIETPQAVTVIDQEDLEAEQPTTIGDALRDLPGITTVGSDRVLGESFNIRGFGTATSSDESRIIVQVDGATKFHEQYRLGSLFTDPELYKSIEVLRGPASSTLYGSGALAGVIRLETKDASDYLADDDPFALRQKFEFSSNGEGFLTSTVVAWRPADNVDILAAFNYRSADEIQDGNGNEIAGSDFDAPSALIKGAVTFGQDDAHEFGASYQYWTTEARSTYAQTETSPAFGLVDRETTDTTAILEYNYLPPGNDLIDLGVTFSYSESDVEQSNASNVGAFGGSTLFQDTHYAYEFIETRVENTSTFTGENYENYLTIGIQTQNQTRTADSISEGFPPGPGSVPAGETEGISFHPGGESSGVGVYIQNEFIYRDVLTIIPGIRYDTRELQAGALVPGGAGDVSDSAVSPKIAAFYQFNPVFGAFGSVAYTERLPVIDEIFDTSSGNPNLDKETSINYEAGFAFSFDNVLDDGDALALKGTFFRNDVEDLIERAGTGFPYFNVGEAEIHGFELEGSYEGEYLFSRLAFTTLRGEGRDDPSDPIEPLLSIPADELALTIGARLPQHGLSYGVRMVAAAEQDLVPTGRATTPGYVVLDLFSAWRPQQGPLAGTEFRFGVENLLDHQYREALATNLVGDNAKGQTFKFTIARQF